MKLIDIKGKRDYIRFILEDETYIKGDGELLSEGFCVYEKTLARFDNNGAVGLLSPGEVSELKAEVALLTKNVSFNVIFE